MNTRETLKFAEKLAVKTGKFQIKKLKQARNISYKGKHNLVTDVDTASENIIIKAIRKNFPDHNILAEESGYSHNADNVFKWIIDPLDGTTNYAHNFPFFCVSIGLETESGLTMGVVYDPSRDELYSAIKGHGARCNNKKIKVSGIDKISESLLTTGFPYRFGKKQKQNLNNFKNFMFKSQAVRRAGSAALDLCYVACGKFEGYWELDLNPWDTAAAAVILTEAGGRITDFSGGCFNHYKKEILATNGRIHGEMLNILAEENTKN